MADVHIHHISLTCTDPMIHCKEALMERRASRFGKPVVVSLVAVLAALLTACAERPGSDNPIYMTPNQPLLQPGSAFLAPGGDYRMITVRMPSENGQDVLCSEPSPDWATALGTTQAIAASGGVSGGPSASLNASASQTEAITAMLGRTAGVIALRDGLYSACQAYANKIIGKDAYALILSQYGNLLVALAGSGAGGSGGASQAGNAQAAQMQQQAVQAMLVACISEYDQTLRPSGPTNSILAEHCGPFLRQVASASGELLKPQSPQSPSAASIGSTRAAATRNGGK